MGNTVRRCIRDIDHVCTGPSGKGNRRGGKSSDEDESSTITRNYDNKESALNEFHGETFQFYLPDDSISNNKFFHPVVDNKIYEKIIYNTPEEKLKDLVHEKGYLMVGDNFKSKLFKTRGLISQYQKLLKNIKSFPTLTIEIVSGSEFKQSSDKVTPFVEISQDISQLPEYYKNKASGLDSTRIESNENASILSAGASSILEKDLGENFDDIYSNKLIHSTRIPNQSNSKGVHEWSKIIKMPFDPEVLEKQRYFTVNLYKTKKNRFKAKQFGKPKTFGCLLFRDQMAHEIVLDFRESFQSQSEGKVMLRIQYVDDESSLYSQILKKLARREQLILEGIKALESLEEVINQEALQLKENFQVREDTFAQGAKFYLNDDQEIEETDSSDLLFAPADTGMRLGTMVYSYELDEESFIRHNGNETSGVQSSTFTADFGDEPQV